MPTYGYRCEQCSLEFEVWQRMSDEPAATCPSCGGSGRRQFYPAGIVFKGTGFYKTDNRSSGSNSTSTTSSTKSESSTPASTPKSTDKSTDSGSTSSGTSADSSG